MKFQVYERRTQHNIQVSRWENEKVGKFFEVLYLNLLNLSIRSRCLLIYSFLCSQRFKGRRKKSLKLICRLPLYFICTGYSYDRCLVEYQFHKLVCYSCRQEYGHLIQTLKCSYVKSVKIELRKSDFKIYIYSNVFQCNISTFTSNKNMTPKLYIFKRLKTLICHDKCI